MKKSFMTRVLATGLSFAMAFSMAAATNVSVASAASKPAMASKQFAVRVGGAAKSYKASAATQKSYKISKATVGNTSKATVKVNSTKKSIKVTPGTVTGSTVVTIKFLNTKTKKYTSKKYRCVVKAAKEEKLTMTAKATHVNEVEVAFNKAVGSDAKITLTKGTTTISQTTKIADDGKSATLTLAGKLTAGTYTVTVVAGDVTLTADIEAKDEVLTSFELGSTLKETKRETGATTTAAIISYKALNQYGDKINYTPETKAVTVSIGKIEDGAITACKTSAAGTITVTDINTLYAIAGQSFTFVIVDTQNGTGVTLNTTAVYGAGATAKTFEYAGTYNTSKAAFKDIAENDKVKDYELLFTAKDQYGDDMAAKDVAKLASDGALTVTVAGGLTNVTARDLKGTTVQKVREIGDKAYFAVPLTGSSIEAGSTDAKANAGTCTVSIVNNTQGIVYTGEFTVTKGVVVQNITINAKDVIYAEEDNELDFTVVDTDGKEIKDYATLTGIKFKPTNDNDHFYWKKNADGTAKLIYKPYTVADGSGNYLAPIKNYEVRSLTIEANKAISGNLKVTSKTFTVYHKRIPQSVAKVKASTVCVGTKSAEVKLSDLVLLDQWYNAMDSSNAEAQKAKIVVSATESAIHTTAASFFATGKAVKYASAEAVTAGSVNVYTTMSAIDTLYAYTNDNMTLNFKVAGSKINPKEDDGLDVKFTQGDSMKVSGLQVTSVNWGNDCWAGTETWDQANVITSNSIEVKGLINGVLTKLDYSQYKVVEADSNGDIAVKGVGKYDKVGAKTETRTIHVVVNTVDGEQTIEGTYVASNIPSTVKSITKISTTSTWGEYSMAYPGQKINYTTGTVIKARNGAVSSQEADSLFVVKNQYGGQMPGNAKLTFVTKKITVSGSGVKVDGSDVDNGKTVDASLLKTSNNGTAFATISVDSNRLTGYNTGVALTAEIEVTATLGDCSAIETITVQFGND